MKNILYYLSVFLLSGCGGKGLEGNSYSTPGSSGKIGTPTLAHLKEEKKASLFFSLGPYLTLNFNQPTPTYYLNWLTNDAASSFQVEYGTLKEKRKEASLTKNNFSKNLQVYSASLSPLLKDKDYSCTVLRNFLSCHTQVFHSFLEPLKWTAVLITKPSNKKIEAIKKLNPQWIFTSWQPKNWASLSKQKSFFDLSSLYIWNPLSKELNFFRSSKKNDLFLSFKPVVFKIGTEFKSMVSSIPTFWLTPQKIVFTGLSVPLEFPENGFVYLEKNETELTCSLYDSKGVFTKKYDLEKI